MMIQIKVTRCEDWSWLSEFLKTIGQHHQLVDYDEDDFKRLVETVPVVAYRPTNLPTRRQKIIKQKLERIAAHSPVWCFIDYDELPWGDLPVLALERPA